MSLRIMMTGSHVNDGVTITVVIQEYLNHSKVAVWFSRK